MTAPDRLRDAARVLRDRAEAATPGPWGANASSRVLVTTMHPGVALAVADWLDEEVARGNERDVFFYSLSALAVADAILGGGA